MHQGTDNCNKGTDNRSDGRALLQTELTPTVRFQQRLPLLPMTKDAAVSAAYTPSSVPQAGVIAVAVPTAVLRRRDVIDVRPLGGTDGIAPVRSFVRSFVRPAR